MPAALAERVAEAEAAVGLPADAIGRNLEVWRMLADPEQVAVYTVPDEYIQMTHTRGWLAVSSNWARANGADGLLRWLIETVDGLDDAYFEATVPDREHLSWAVSNYDDSWVRRLPRNDFLAEAFRRHSPAMTANREHRVVSSGATADIGLEAQYVALDASEDDPASIRDLVRDWGQAVEQTAVSEESMGHAVAIRTRIASYLALADERGYAELINDAIDTLDEHDDRFRATTGRAANLADDAPLPDLAQWWTRRNIT